MQYLLKLLFQTALTYSQRQIYGKMVNGGPALHEIQCVYKWLWLPMTRNLHKLYERWCGAEIACGGSYFGFWKWAKSFLRFSVSQVVVGNPESIMWQSCEYHTTIMWQVWEEFGSDLVNRRINCAIFHNAQQIARYHDGQVNRHAIHMMTVRVVTTILAP